MDIDLANIFLTSGVNEAGEGFVTVSAHSSEGGIILIGQLTPNQIREHGAACFEAAEAADQDAAVFRVFRKLGLEDNMIGMVIVDLRNTRGD